MWSKNQTNQWSRPKRRDYTKYPGEDESGGGSLKLSNVIILLPALRDTQGGRDWTLVCIGWLGSNKEQDGRKLALSNYRNALKPNPNSSWVCMQESNTFLKSYLFYNPYEAPELVNISRYAILTVTITLSWNIVLYAFVPLAYSFLPRRLINSAPICLHLKSGLMYNKIFLFSIYKIRTFFFFFVLFAFIFVHNI